MLLFINFATFSCIFLFLLGNFAIHPFSNPSVSNLEQNACFSNPCENGGTCAQGSKGGFACICPEGFQGPQCTMGE